MKNRIGIILIGIAAVILTGCTYLQSYFPDKERDYQYTTEIPLINYPADLRNNQSTSSASAVTSPADSLAESGAGATTDLIDQPPANNISPDDASEAATTTTPETFNTPVTPATESDERDTVSSVEIIRYDDGESRLRLGAGHSKSWRVINKALSRKTIEVTERNHEQAQIVVQYDPDEEKVKDEGFMDEIMFIFHGINTNEKEYVLKLEQHDQQTDVIVLNGEHLPLLNDDAALRLLKVMADTIKADLVEKAE